MGDQAPLESLAEVNPRSPSARVGELVSFVAMADVSERGYLENVDVRPASPGYTSFVEGDVLLAKITPCMENGKGAHVRELPVRQGQGSTEFHVLRARTGTSDRFLYHLTRTESFRLSAEALMTGSAGQRRVPTEFFTKYCVRVPPLEEQRRIAEILDTIDETIQATEQILAKRRLLRMALIREQVRSESGAARSAGWVDVRIGDAVRQHVEPVRIEDHQAYDLISIRRRHGGMFHRESLPGSAILDKRMQRVVPATFVIARRQIVHGACALATSEFAESVMSMSYSAFVGTPICDVRFFFALAQTPTMIKQFWDASHGVVVEKLNFQQAEWLDYRIQLPPIEVQRRVVSAVEASEVEISALEDELEALRGVREGLASDLLSGRVRTVAT